LISRCMPLDFFDDTIAAIGTPPGESAIGVVRLSGPNCEVIAEALFRSPHGKTRLKSHYLHFGHIVDPSTQKPVDEVLVSLMRAPKTYTREDVLEIQCHGGIQALKRILELVIEAGARPAGPGEFTKRAYLNGRIDLTQAEAVMDLIRSRSMRSLAFSARQIMGELRDEIVLIRDNIVDLLAQVEVAIDFPEEDVEIIPSYQAQALLTEMLVPRLESLLQTYIVGRLYRDGLSVAIAGKPNVGKSSLLNSLLKEKRAIVTPHPGTTRDVIEESIDLDGLPVRIMDTAGLRETRDEIELISLEFTRDRLKFADLILWVVDLSTCPDAMDDQVFKVLHEKVVIGVANKCDLCPGKTTADLETRYPGISMITVSALYGEGLNKLKEAIQHTIRHRNLESISGPIITRTRHKLALERCVEFLKKAAQCLADGLTLDRMAVDLQGALQELGEIVGLVTTDDILERIFSEFCIGK
jgi:tRNA modification GTPase